MNWLEFIASIIEALIWPGLFLVIIILFKKELVGFLDANRVKRIRGGPFEAEFFESISKAREALQESIEENQNSEGGDVNNEEQHDSLSYSVYQDDLILEYRPEYAVLESWKQLESALQLAASVTTATKSRYRPVRKVIFDLVQQQVITPALGEALLELNDARNAIVHAKDFRISRQQAEEYMSVVQAALLSVQKYSEGH